MPNTNLPWNAGMVSAGFAATEHPTVRDIAWAAGVYEGEGYAGIGNCWRGRNAKRRNTPYKRITVRVSQKDRWLCDRLKALFGGAVRTYTAKANSIKNPELEREYNCWDIYGTRALGFIQTIYTFLSPRRQAQIRLVLDGARRVSI